MEILLIRHGQAVDDAPGLGDSGRWLNEKGRKVTRKIARWLAKKGRRRPLTIWTSPLVRAVQTAEIIAAAAGIEGEVRAVSELMPGRDPGDLVRLLADPPPGPLALIGHEPSLSLIAAALLGDIGFTGLKKSGVMGVTFREGRGRLRFLLDPAEKKAQKRFAAAPPTEVEPAPPTGSMA